METIASGGVKWIHIVKADKHDLAYLRKNFSVHPIVLKELEEPSVRTRVDNFGTYLFLVYQFPVYNELERVSERVEVDFIITKNTVVTVSYRSFPFIRQFAKSLQSNSVLKKKVFGNSFQLTYHLIQTILNFSVRQLTHIGENVESISQRLFNDHEKEILQEISYLKRDVSEYRIVFRSQNPLLKSLMEVGTAFWGKSSRPYIEDLQSKQMTIASQLEDYREAIIDFEQTNNQLLNAKTTGVMKLFTILAFFTFPLTLVSAIFSMPTITKPIIGMEGDFWIIVGGMAVLATAMLLIIKLKKWL